jgi:hypothetical protein
MKTYKLITVLLIVFLCISIALVVLDQLIFRPLFPEYYVYVGMSFNELVETMGSEYTDLGSGICMPQWELLFGRLLTVHMTVEIDGTYVRDCNISGFGDPSYCRFILPFVITALGLAELLLYYIAKRKRDSHAST